MRRPRGRHPYQRGGRRNPGGEWLRRRRRHRQGREIEARAVVSNLHPKLTFEKLLDPATLPADFRARIGAWRSASGVFRMNLALGELPSFSCLPDATRPSTTAQEIVIAPSLAYMERAYTDARRSGWSEAPIVKMLIPSVLDETLAPPGQHVASLFCQYVAPKLPGGRSWDEARETVADLMIDAVEAYAPGFKASVIARQILSPLDLERDFGRARRGRHFPRLPFARSALFGAARARPRRLSVAHSQPLYGRASTHPGGGVSGAPGRNAAREILRDFQAEIAAMRR